MIFQTVLDKGFVLLSFYWFLVACAMLKCLEKGGSVMDRNGPAWAAWLASGILIWLAGEIASRHLTEFLGTNRGAADICRGAAIIFLGLKMFDSSQ